MLKDVVLTNGYAENMNKFSYFPNGAVGGNRVALVANSDVEDMIRCIQDVDSLNVYVVREDDPCLDDVLVGNVEEEEEQENEDEACDFYRNDYVESDGSDDDEDGKIEFFCGTTVCIERKVQGDH